MIGTQHNDQNAEPTGGGLMLIDCEACVVRGPACGDCVVTVLLATPAGRPADAVDLDGAERAALAVLAGSGLVPPLRLASADPEAAGRNVRAATRTPCREAG